jgi:hypothetical protein
MNTTDPRTGLPRRADPLGSNLRRHVPAFGLCFIALIGSVTVGARRAEAQGRSLIPDFSGERVYAVDTPDQYGPLREDIRRLERNSPQTYYVVVIPSAGTGRKATRDYLEVLVGQWKSQAAARKIPFDTKRSVIIVLALQNRQIIVLGGEELQEKFGFRDPYIERDLLEPHFFAYARSGDHVRGLRVLVAQIDRWIAERDGALARRREEAAARDANQKKDAEATISRAKALLQETRKELETRKTAGLVVGPLEAQARRAADDLDTASRRLDTSASEALTLSQQANRDLQGVVDRLRHLSSLQADLDERLLKSTALSGEVLKAIEQSGRDGLPVAPVQRELDDAVKRIDQAGKVIQADPEQATKLIDSIDGRLSEALEHVRKLPEYHREAQQKAKVVQALEQSASTELARARRAGVAGGGLDPEWEETSKRLASARAALGTDDRQAVTGFNTAEASLTRIHDTAKARLDRHRLVTRDLPLAFLAGALALGLLIVGLFWLRKRHLSRVVDEKFKCYRQNAVGLMDRLDALRQRHKTLRASDPDFTEPMTGATLALYREVETDLNDLWERWLRIMEVWEDAQKKVRAGSGLGVKQTEDAKALLEKEGDFEGLLGRAESCQERLDRLKQGHEQARAAIKAGTDESDAVGKKFDEVAATGLPVDRFQAELDSVGSLFHNAESLVTPDPIGAGRVAARGREAAAGIAEHVNQVLTRYKEAESVLASADEVADRTLALRRGGLRLSEATADPDPKLAQAREQHGAALAALRKADPAGAGRANDRARAAVEEARQGIERHLQARDLCAKELPARKDAARKLDADSSHAKAIVRDLGQGFAAESWTGVPEGLAQADSLVRSAVDRIRQAEADTADHSQDYLKAASGLAQAAQEQDRAGQLLAGIVARHQALTELAEQSRALAHDLDAQSRQVEAFFDGHRDVIGPEARRSIDQADQALRALSGVMAHPRPNWPDVRRRIDLARQGLTVAQKQAQDDVEGDRRVAQKLDAVRSKAQQVGRFLQGEAKDRPPANQRYQAAAQALDAFGRMERAPGDWDRMSGRLDEIAATLDRAESLAQQDVSLANGAIAEISEASRALREAQAYYAEGMTADISAAESELSRARGTLANQHYEQAIELANSAERLAREAREAAAHEARRRRMQSERAQVGFNLPDAASILIAAQAAARAAGGWTGGIDISSSPAPPMPTDAGTPSGSWGRGSDGGDWTGGADEATW